MILVTHAVAGAAAGIVFRTHPVLAFFAGFASHFVLDAIPHWHYELTSFEKDDASGKKVRFSKNDRALLRDVLVTALDCGAGFAIAFYAAWTSAPDAIGAATLGAVGGVLPDFLQLVHYLFPNSPLRFLQNFHLWIHADTRLDHRPAIGISSQLALLVVFAATLARFH